MVSDSHAAFLDALQTYTNGKRKLAAKAWVRPEAAGGGIAYSSTQAQDGAHKREAQSSSQEFGIELIATHLPSQGDPAFLPPSRQAGHIIGSS